jgi:hypothetical protein
MVDRAETFVILLGQWDQVVCLGNSLELATYKTVASAAWLKR